MRSRFITSDTVRSSIHDYERIYTKPDPSCLVSLDEWHTENRLGSDRAAFTRVARRANSPAVRRPGPLPQEEFEAVSNGLLGPGLSRNATQRPRGGKPAETGWLASYRRSPALEAPG